jgi:hypothetical protein
LRRSSLFSRSASNGGDIIISLLKSDGRPYI